MRHTCKITIYSLLLLSPLAIFASVDTLQTKAADTLGRNRLRDSLTQLQEQRKTLCAYPLKDNDIFFIPTARLFSGDATGPSEALKESPFSIPVRFGISSQLNRFLPFGSVAPVMTVFKEGSLQPVQYSPLRGTDDVALNELSSIAVEPNNTYRYSLFPEKVAVPEGSFYWENGVFNENILNARFLRPLSDRMTINLFSTYRYFNAQRFSHDGNNIFTFYKQLYADSTAISDTGYNPLTKEFDAGTRLRWTGEAGNEVIFGAKYADWSTDVALDRFSALNASGVTWARLNQYRSSFDFGIIKNRFGRSVVDVTGYYDDNTIVNRTPDSTGVTLLRKDGYDRTLSFAARAASPLLGTDTVALLYRVKQNSRGPFNMPESRSFDHTPEASYTFPYNAGPLQGGFVLNAGYIICKLDTTIGYAPTWSVSADNGVFGQRLRVYATQGVIPYAMPFDSALFPASTLLDLYRMGGVDITLAGPHAGCTAGFQSIEGVSDDAIRLAWPEGVPPYAQPHLVFLAAPYFGPWHGLTLTSRGLFADRKPFVKAQASASYTANPRNTGEYIDLRLCFDYWSGRDALLFANSGDWSREIYDLNLEIAVQVKTFRFFSKIDNILNRRIAYMPGYALPGLMFRWGITWFLQR